MSHLLNHQLLGRLPSANMNITTDQAIPMNSSNYVITAILVINASLSLTTAAGGVYNDVSKPAGGILVAATQAYSALTSSSKYLLLTLASLATTDKQTAANLYLSLTTAQGAAATAEIRVYGYRLD